MKNFFLFLSGAIVGAGVWGLVHNTMLFESLPPLESGILKSEKGSKFGNWLAAQHAVYSDDFESAAVFMRPLADVDFESVAAMRNLVLFLENGDIGGISAMRKSNASAFMVINAANSAKAGKWKAVYAQFKNEKSQTMAPFRIWSSVATGNFTKALAFIDGFSRVNNSWKNFAKGAIYAATKNPKTARKFFMKVSPSFMNLGDYRLVMSFYKKYGFTKDADALREKWVESPGGMYMVDVDFNPDWADYDSYQEMLAAQLVQNVSHSGEGGFTDSGLLVLRTAALLSGETDSVRYYTGGYFYAAGSDNYERYWDKLRRNPIYAPFVEMKIAEKAGSDAKMERKLNRILRKSPLFMPAIQKLWRINMQNGRENDILRVLNRALKQPNVSDSGRAYLLKLRAHSFYIAGDLAEAALDLETAEKLSPMDAEVMGLMARVWASQNTNIDEAYRYAISLIKAFPANVENWNVLAVVVRAKEGPDAALEILERIGRVAEECSELFLNLGDLRLAAGLKMSAVEAYKKAILLSDDGLVIREEVEEKLEEVERSYK